MGGGTFGMDELVPAPDVKYPATPGPTDEQNRLAHNYIIYLFIYY